MLRAFQVIGSSSSSSSSSSSFPLQKWKPLIFIKSSFSSRAAAAAATSSSSSSPMLLPIITSSTVCNVRSFRISAIHSESKSDDASVSPSHPPLAHLRKVSFCGWCGSTTKQIIPDGDDKIRDVCTHCGKIAYQNPKMVVGCLVEHEDKILLCKRKIQPSYGLWTLPSGFLELGESAVQGAARETLEEACAEVEVKSPFAQLDIPYIGHSYFFFRAKLRKPHFAPGPESLDCRLFAPDDIPFDSLAFSSMVVSLNWYIEDLKAGITPFHYCSIKKRPGSGASDICAYTLDSNLQS